MMLTRAAASNDDNKNIGNSNNDSKNSSSIMFRTLGTYLQTHAVVHVDFQLDYRFLQQHCALLEEDLKTTRAKNHTARTTRYYNTLARTIDHACQDVNEITWIRPEAKKRQKRQIGFAIAAVTSVFAWYEANKVDHLTTLLRRAQDDQLSVLKQEDHRIDDLKKALNATGALLAESVSWTQNISSELDQISWLQEKIALANEFATHVIRVGQGLQELRRGRLSPSILGKADGRRLLSRLRDTAVKLNGKPTIDHAEDLYQLPVTTIASYPYQLQALLHVGITRAPMSLFRYLPSPLTIMGNESNVALIPSPEKKLLVRNLQQHAELEDSDLDDCHRHANTYVCNGPTAFHTQPAASCLGALYLADLDKVRQLCPIRQTNIGWTAEVTADEQLALYFRERTTAQITCPGKPRKNRQYQGSSILRLAANCSLTAVDLVIAPHLDVLVQAPLASTPNWDLAQFLEGQTPEGIQRAREQLQQQHLLPDDDLRRMVQQLDRAKLLEERDFFTVADHSPVIYVTAAVVATLVAAVLARYACLCYHSNRQTDYWVQ